MQTAGSDQKRVAAASQTTQTTQQMDLKNAATVKKKWRRSKTGEMLQMAKQQTNIKTADIKCCKLFLQNTTPPNH